MTHRTEGKTFLLLPVYDIIKDILKDTDEKPGEENHRIRFDRVLRARASVSVELKDPSAFYACACVH